MPNLDITKTYADGEIPFERDLDNIRDAILDLLNSTKLDSDNINDGAITTAKIADGAVTTSKIPSGTVSASKIAASAITAVKIEDDAVTTAKILNDAVTTTKIEDDAVTRSKLGDRVFELSSSSANFTTSSTSNVDITNLTVSVTTTGRRLVIRIVPDGSTSLSYIGVSNSAYPSTGAWLTAVRDSTDIGSHRISALDIISPTGAGGMNLLPSGYMFSDAPAAGTYTYKIKGYVLSGSGTNTLAVVRCKLLVYEE